MKHKSIEVILSYKGKYAIKKVPQSWPEILLPARKIASYISGVQNVDSDDDIKFVPSGKKATKDNKTYDVWVEKVNNVKSN